MAWPAGEADSDVPHEGARAEQKGCAATYKAKAAGEAVRVPPAGDRKRTFLVRSDVSAHYKQLFYLYLGDEHEPMWGLK